MYITDLYSLFRYVHPQRDVLFSLISVRMHWNREWKCKTAPVIKWTGCRLIGLGFNLFPRRRSEIVLIFFYFALLECDVAIFLLHFNSIISCLDICWNFLKYRSIVNVMGYVSLYICRSLQCELLPCDSALEYAYMWYIFHRTT